MVRYRFAFSRGYWTEWYRQGFITHDELDDVLAIERMGINLK